MIKFICNMCKKDSEPVSTSGSLSSYSNLPKDWKVIHLASNHTSVRHTICPECAIKLGIHSIEEQDVGKHLGLGDQLYAVLQDIVANSLYDLTERRTDVRTPRSTD